jgi:TonB family protein
MVGLLVAPVFVQGPSATTWPRVPPIVFVDLAYPPQALAARVVGRVVVRVTTDAAGRVVEAESLSGPALLAPAALANIRQWTLSPGVSTGTVVYRFEIDHATCNDDSRSLFRLAQPNLAIITACTGPGRVPVASPSSALGFVSWGGDSPQYPAWARKARLTGVIVLDLSIDAGGVVVDSRALTDLPVLTEAAVAHSKTWRAYPGAPRRGIMVYEFALDNPACDRRDQTAFWMITADYMRLSACEMLVDR